MLIIMLKRFTSFNVDRTERLKENDTSYFFFFVCVCVSGILIIYSTLFFLIHEEKEKKTKFPWIKINKDSIVANY